MSNWLNSTFYQFDFTVAKAFNSLARGASGILTPLADLLALLGKGGIFLLIVSLSQPHKKHFSLLYHQKNRCQYKPDVAKSSFIVYNSYIKLILNQGGLFI